MEERNKKHYVAPSMKVYEIEPTQILTGSTKVSVSSWGNGNSWAQVKWKRIGIY